MMTIGILHPGRMGAAVAAEAVKAGSRVLWCPEGRSADTAERARTAGLEAADDLGALLRRSEIVISLCPPADAVELATTVQKAGFSGIFVEANAISPQRTDQIAGELTRVGATVVDGCVIGPPPPAESGTRLYLSGQAAEIEQVKRIFEGTAVEAVAIDGGVGDASALKMAYGSYQKASCALAAVSHALAGVHGVADHLTAEGKRLTGSHLATPENLPSVAARAWRWAPEMEEGAAALRAAGLPADLSLAAATVFEHWADDKDAFDITLPEVLAQLLAVVAR
jgi:3-hydroxyisobutyrate dehydrogenase-like beta-hydroxyacid dehydrogenase